MITATHVTILHGDGERQPELIVASRDILATRYTSGSFVLTLLFRDRSSSRRYLVYVNRTWVDGASGVATNCGTADVPVDAETLHRLLTRLHDI